MPSISTVVFDLGGVLIDWNPRYLYRQLIPDAAKMEQFLAEVCSPAWNATLDAGRPFGEAIAELVEKHPDQVELIEAYRSRWPEMLGGCNADTLELVRRLRAAGIRTLALSNWAVDTFEATRRRFPFLDEFDGILLSGEVGVSKPDEAIFREFVDRFALTPHTTVFIDDSAANVTTARSLGIVALHFESAAKLETDLLELGLPV
jgi:2-haloacid dehalogenase